MNESLQAQGAEILKSAGFIGACIAVVVAFVLAIILLRMEIFNAIFSTLLAIAFTVGMVFVVKEYGEAFYKEGSPWLSIGTGIAVFIWMFIRFMPAISSETEKNTYLIFGTLLEETETTTNFVGVIISALFMGGVFGGLTYLAFCYKWLFAFYLVGPILVIIGVVGIIRYFVDSY